MKGNIAIATLLTTLGSALCATAEKPCAVWGSLYPPDASGTSMVELIGSRDVHKQRTRIDSRGHFEFDPVPAGLYNIRVLDRFGTLLLHDHVVLAGAYDPIYLQMPRPSTTVSMSQLSRKLPADAVRSLREIEAHGAGDAGSAIQSLERIIKKAPGFAEAENDLGVLYVAAGQSDKAILHFTKAFELYGASAGTGINLANVLIGLSRYSQAESVLREILKRDASVGECQILLAACEIILNEDIENAEDRLDRFGQEYPASWLNAAELLRRNRHYRQAADQLRKFLTTGDVHRCDRLRLERVLLSLDSAARLQETTAAAQSQMEGRSVVKDR